MKKLLYTILLSLGTFLFTACTDYINVDKYFYDQVSLDSAFSKRVYVEGWLSSAYSVMDNIGEYREPFRWASDDLYHPDMKEYVEGNYSADHQLSDDDRNNSRLWKYYEGIRKASTFIDNVDRCPELTMDEKTDLKGQARFLRAYCYLAKYITIEIFHTPCPIFHTFPIRFHTIDNVHNPHISLIINTLTAYISLWHTL